MLDVATAEDRPHPRLALLWRWQAVLLGLVAGGAASLLLLALRAPIEAAGSALLPRLGGPVVGGVAVGLAVSLLLLLRARAAARVYRWQHRPGEGVVVWKGAWWQREIWIPLKRLQHLDIQRGPLERWLGLATLELYTAGSHAYETKLPGLALEQAQGLRDGLLAEVQALGRPLPAGRAA